MLSSPRLLPVCLIAMVALLLALHIIALPKITHKSRVDALGLEELISMPTISSPNRNIELKLEYEPWQQNIFKLHSATCVTSVFVNGKAMELHNITSCGYYKGLTLYMRDFLKPGENSIVIHAEGEGRVQFGPVIFSKRQWGLTGILGLVLVGVACAICVLAMRRYTGENFSGALLACGFLMYMHQFSTTSFLNFSMDLEAHLEYISYIINNLQLPPTRFGFVTHHPPVYYTLAYLVFLLADWMSSFDTLSVLRSFSLGCFMVLMAFSILTLRRLITNPAAYYMSVLLLVMYPSGIMSATRIDSHALYYAWYGPCVYFLLRWMQENKDRYLGFSLTFCGLAMATRTNAYVLFPIIAVAMLYQWRTHRMPLLRFSSKAVRYGFLILCCGIALNRGRIMYYNNTLYSNEPVIIGNMDRISPNLGITNSAGKMLLLDMDSYIRYPFWDSYKDEAGRQYFWNSMLKTSLFGEFTLQHHRVASLLGYLLLAMIAYVTASAALWWRHIARWREWLVAAALAAIPVVGLMKGRWFYPYSCVQDFRYIYPAVVGLCALMGLTVERYMIARRYPAAFLGFTLALLFSSYCVYFSLAQ